MEFMPVYLVCQRCTTCFKDHILNALYVKARYATTAIGAISNPKDRALDSSTAIVNKVVAPPIFNPVATPIAFRMGT